MARVALLRTNVAGVGQEAPIVLPGGELVAGRAACTGQPSPIVLVGSTSPRRMRVCSQRWLSRSVASFVGHISSCDVQA